ncbi:hypothetical protein HYQ46_008799 [Verticillium longisporum]|nr:hypothetical protein HYQ46_008799 [Verticillium longisporum]
MYRYNVIHYSHKSITGLSHLLNNRHLVFVVSGVPHSVVHAEAHADDAAGDPAAVDEPPPAVLDALEANLDSGQAREDLFRVGVVLEGDALDARLGVVLDVHVGVDHVVQHRPGNVGRVEAGGGRQRRAVGEQIDAKGGEAHEGAPGECQAEDGLRVREGEEDAETREQLGTGEDESVERRDSAAGDGAETRASDVRIKVAVPQVVDGTAGAAHDESAGEEEEGWEEEVVGAGWLVDTDELCVGDP